MIPRSVLLFVHPPFFEVGNKVFFDTQAQNGLRLWAQNFDVVRVMAPHVRTRSEDIPNDVSELQPTLDAFPQIEPVMLPRRGTWRFLTEDLRPGRALIRDHIGASQYLVFGFSGYVGDWGTVACREAATMGRPYAIFKDGVAHRVARITQIKKPRSLPLRLRHRMENWLMKHLDRKTVRQSTLALLHGQDTMDYYGRFASNAQLVHDIHISKADRVTQDELETRLKRRDRNRLQVVYAGRVEEIKGPNHWVAAVAQAARNGTAISARWYGTGSLLDAQTAQTGQHDLDEIITFRGFVAHRQMLTEIRDADLFLFTHMTEESPRCLIEALAAGLPLVGYDSAYPRNLVGNSQAGLFVPRGDSHALARALTDLAADPDRLEAMARDARRVAEPLNDEDVFRHRSDIIKQAL